MTQPVLTDLFVVPVADLRKPAHFDGATYQPARDHARLSGQLHRVAEAMRDGRWRTLGEIEALTGDPPQSISARLRDLRKPKFGAFEVDHRVRVGTSALWEYRVR